MHYQLPFLTAKNIKQSSTLFRYFRTPENAQINRTGTDNNRFDMEFDLIVIDVSSTCSKKQQIQFSPIHPATFPGNPAQTTTSPSSSSKIYIL